MLGPMRFDRIASRLAAAVTLSMPLTSPAWGQGPSSLTPAGSPPAPPGSAGTASGVMALVFVAAIVAAIIVAAWYLSTRRKRLEEAAILQARLSDVIARETQFRGLVVTPKGRVSAWCGTPMTIEVTGDVPTPELREAVMRTVRTEVSTARPDVIAEDHLFIVPPKMDRAS